MKLKIEEIMLDEEELTKTGRHKIKEVFDYIIKHKYNHQRELKAINSINWVYCGGGQWYRDNNKYGDSGHA